MVGESVRSLAGGSMTFILILLAFAIVPSAVLTAAAWSQPSWAIRIIFTTLGIIPVLLFLSEIRFLLPIRWRKNPTWDTFLCRIGSHRCLPLCASGCCWECIRCKIAKAEGRGES
jgi:hypothetical protein